MYIARQPLSSESSSLKCQVTEVLFIDQNLEQAAMLAAGVRPNVEVILLPADEDGMAQMTAALAMRCGIRSLHLVSHGMPGNIQLGNTWLCVEMLSVFAAELQVWADSLTSEAELLIYSSEVGKGDRGLDLVSCLSELIGAKVAASATKTGNPALEGNWDLEVKTGEIESLLAFQPETLAIYKEIL